MALRSRSKSKVGRLRLDVWSARLPSVAFVILSLCVFLFSSVRPGFLGGVRTSVSDALVPVLVIVNAPINHAAEYVRAVTGIADMQAENARLREENARLRDWYQTALQLEEQNKSLQKLLNIKLPPHHSYITAMVVADSGNSYVRSILVLGGADDGISKGQVALAGEGVVGRVIDVGKKTARILLLTDINSRIPVIVQGEDYKAIMGGDNTELPRLDHLAPDMHIEEGARVITSGHGGIFPYGLPVGETEIGKDGNVSIRLYADIRRVNFVRIVDTSSDPNLFHKEDTGL